MKTIGVSQFKQQCLSLLDHLEPEGLIVTKRGKPVACVIPYSGNDSDLIGSLSHKIAVRGQHLHNRVPTRYLTLPASHIGLRLP